MKNCRIISIIILVMFFASSAWAATYYVDFSNGSDSNNGTSTSTPFRHAPGDAACVGTCAGVTLHAGDSVIFKRGVTYQSGPIVIGSSGAIVVLVTDAAASKATISASGVLSDPQATFQTDGVKSGQYIYIFHNVMSQTNTSVESSGLWQIASVESQTQIILKDFDGKAYSLNVNGGLTYGIVNPITYRSISTWGSGDATIDGQNIRPYLIDLNGKSEIRIDSLRFINTYDNGVHWMGAITSTQYSRSGNLWADTSSNWNEFVNCTFENLGISSISYAGSYTVAKNNIAKDVAYNGIGVGDYYTLDDGNTVTGPGTRCGLGGYAFAIIRNNYCKDMTSGYGGAHADGIGFIDGGPNGNNACATGTGGGNCYGWIYNNTVDNSIEFLAIYDGNTSIHYWTIHDNVFIGRFGTGTGCTSYGDDAIATQGGPTHLLIANNDFISSSGCKGFNSAIAFKTGYGSYPSDIRIENNIFATNGNAFYLQGGAPQGFVTNYNYYYTSGLSPFLINSTSKTFAQWQASGYDMHGINGTGPNYTSQFAPNFISIDSMDFGLFSPSFAIGSGSNLSAYFTLDAAGVLYPITSWNMGASSSVLSPPINLRFSAP